ncbi:MAG: hypothetical protein JNN17_05700 [Verrucomicrobiaceae bacterium]|nr:hypothetical protein [Verrucomicrobiaceae bacterium]
MKNILPALLAPIISLTGCTLEDSRRLKQQDTSGMSREAAKMWDDGVQFGPVSPQYQAHATEASKAFEIGIPPATLPPASRNPMNGLQVR